MIENRTDSKDAGEKPVKNEVQRHELKTWPKFFDAVRRGDKRFEIRRNDRGFLPGDFVRLREWEPETEHYTGNWIMARITYVTDFEQKPGFVVFGLKLSHIKWVSP